MPPHRPTIDRFNEKYRPDGRSGCWVWQGSKIRGYGNIRHDGRVILAHRFSYQHFIGPIPDGLLVLHKCNNSRCVNPEHIRLGTHADNMLDMVKSGRRVGRNSGSLLSPLQLKKLRRALAAGMTQKDAAAFIGVNRSTVLRTLKRGLARITMAPRTYLTDEQKQEVLRDLKKGVAIMAIATKFKVDRKTIRNIRSKYGRPAEFSDPAT